MARELAPGLAIPMDFTGPRAGDKENEQFWSDTEIPRPAKTTSMISIESPMPAKGKLRSELAHLHAALGARDVAAALNHLQTLVPDYTPSPALLSLAGQNTPRVNA